MIDGTILDEGGEERVYDVRQDEECVSLVRV